MSCQSATISPPVQHYFSPTKWALLAQALSHLEAPSCSSRAEQNPPYCERVRLCFVSVAERGGGGCQGRGMCRGLPQDTPGGGGRKTHAKLAMRGAHRASFCYFLDLRADCCGGKRDSRKPQSALFYPIVCVVPIAEHWYCLQTRLCNTCAPLVMLLLGSIWEHSVGAYCALCAGCAQNLYGTIWIALVVPPPPLVIATPL